MTKGVKTGGRTKGTPNKITREIKEALQEAFEELGGVASLVDWGRENPTPFYQLWGKMAPVKVEASGPDGEALRIEIVQYTNANYKTAQ